MPSKLQNIQSIFEQAIFRIPDYQRGYAWGERERTALWNDIENLNSNSYHFTGIITLERATASTLHKWDKEFNSTITEGSDVLIEIDGSKYVPYFIVDGQQRMISLIILIFIIKDLLYEKSYYESQELEGKFIWVNTIAGRTYLFGYEKDTPSHQYLIRHIFDDESMTVTEPETIYTHNLAQAKKYFQDKLLNGNIELTDLLSKLQNRLLFNVFEIDTSKVDMSLVFETLNYRGKKLSLLELFKNRLIFLIQKRHPERCLQLRDEIVKAWLMVYEWLGKNPRKELNDDLFLRSFWIMFYNHDNDRDDDFKKWEIDIFENRYRIIGISDNSEISEHKLSRLLGTLSNCVKYWFLTQDPTFECDDFNYDNYKVKQLLTGISRNRYGEFFAPLMMAYFTLHDRRIEADDIVEVLHEIERHNFVVYFFGGRKADTNRPHFLRLINQYFRSKYHHMYIKHEIHRKTDESLRFADIYNNIHKNKSKEQRFKDWDGIKYLLWEYEQKLVGSKEPILESYESSKVDVIFPEGNRNDPSWTKVKRGRNKENMDKLCYSLGNLTITNKIKNSHSYNKLRDQLLEGSYTDREIALNHNEWTDQAILRRGLDLLVFIETKWQIPFIGTPTDKRKLLLDGVQV